MARVATFWEADDKPKGWECWVCGAKTTEVEGCTDDVHVMGKLGEEVTYPKLPVNPVFKQCSDCGALAGKMHHPGCLNEQCPKCRGIFQLCDCE